MLLLSHVLYSVLCSVSVLMSCCHGDRVSGGGARGGCWMTPLLNAGVYDDVTYVLLVLVLYYYRFCTSSLQAEFYYAWCYSVMYLHVVVYWLIVRNMLTCKRC